MGKAPAFQFYAADFLTGTNDMTVDEIGIYIRLLATSWDKGPLPMEPSRLARVAGVEVDRFIPAWQTVRKKWKKTRAGYVNERMEQQRGARQAFVEKQAEKAKRRWVGTATAEPKHKPRHSPGNALQSSVFSLQSLDQDQEQEKIKTVSSEPAQIAVSKPAVLTFPVVGSPEPVWVLTQEQVDEWAALFPAMDLLTQLRAACAWIQASPERRKTARGMKRFLVSWLTRATDAPRTRQAMTPFAARSDKGSRALDAGEQAIQMLRRAAP